MKCLIPIIAIQFVVFQAFSQTISGFTVTVVCDAQSLTGGHPKDATTFMLGVWENGEKNMYIFSKHQLRAGYQADRVNTDSSGHLKSAILKTDLDTEKIVSYGTVEINFSNNNLGKGYLNSIHESTEPYVLGSHELTNCKIGGTK